MNQVKARLEKLGVAKEGPWAKALDAAANDLKEVIEKMDELGKKDDLFKRWCDDIAQIGTTACVEPGSSHKALEGLAITIGTFEIVTRCMV